MNKRRKNPFVVFETIMSLIGKVIFWAILGSIPVVLLVVLPIVGTMNGWAGDRTWFGYIILAAIVVGIFLMLGVLIVTDEIKERFDECKRAWERNNRVEG